MEKLKIVIADDDASSRLLLHHTIRLFNEYEVAGEAGNGEKFYQLVLELKPDIVLVDINMPGLSGLEAVKLCREAIPSLQVVFTTGYEEFAVEAFNISAADYIVKPIERTRLFVALDKAKKALQLERSLSARNRQQHKLSIKSNNTYLYLTIEDLLYIEKEGRKTILHTKNDRYETSESLQDLEEKLPDYFYKTHRSFLVNLTRINKIEPSGETFLAHFSNSQKTAHISKLKINEVQEIIESRGLIK
ncbi:LytR/AlgR family response regulator transcription factor [Cytobacillus firmus]|uniref:LytTR family transcriptional regulator n=1 Tax=Cytobacillus firmus DS1 TaxID=1307436 RepID=W7KVR5_CYTFI|nr:LytTR family DNA-binding domain-containing protein [Cytobacillus firmus]EWG11550.1 LytTR family transcriptional regulator [Cytobacillus firmus DS1]